MITISIADIDLLELFIFSHQRITDITDSVDQILIGPFPIFHYVESFQQTAIDHALIEMSTQLAK